MITRIFLFLFIALLAIGGCKKKSVLNYSDYAGQWVGEFKMQYEYRIPPDYDTWYSANAGFNITIELTSLAPVVNGISILTVTFVRINDPFFDCMMGTTPSNGSIASLPSPPENVSTQAGMGFVILFPNGCNLVTNNQLGALHMSQSGPQIVSNSTDPNIQPVGWNNTVWLASDVTGRSYEAYLMGSDNTYTAQNFRCTHATWAFTHSALSK